MLMRDSVKDASHADADEFLYVVAGEVSLTMSGKQQSLSPGWLVVVPRGTAYSATKKGRNPAILMSVASGPPCS